ncbi:MAG: Ribosomal protein L11 methyltransferase [Gammaproteobacteria bacterium]|nr:Ribosomal protein L11 methyltransferase [Gammaproteobacteria bacterium]
MSWLRLTIDTHADRVGPLTGLLEQFNACCVSYQPVSAEKIFDNESPSSPIWWQQTSVSALLDPDIDIDILLACIRNRIGTDNIHRYSIETLRDANWSEAHKQEFHSMQFAGRLVVRPEWEQAVPTNLPVITLEPGLAFGTGKHATTTLCLEWLATNDLIGKTVIDYGCGSGILALAAARLGAKSVCAVDIDSQALLATRHNAVKNQLLNQIRIAAVADGKPPPADILIANILFNPLLELAPVFADLVQPGGAIVLSGILMNQAQECLECYKQWFKMGLPVYRDEWALLHGNR